MIKIVSQSISSKKKNNVIIIQIIHQIADTER